MATQPRQQQLIATLTIPQRAAFLEYLKGRVTMCSSDLASFREVLTYRDKVYQRQLDITQEHIKSALANKRGDARKLQNMTVPIVMPQVESATAYQASVFLTSSPIFGVVSKPGAMDQAMAFEALLDNQANKNGWTRQLIMAFRNGFKHNFGPVFVGWQSTPVKSITTSTASATAGQAELKSSFVGSNIIKAIDPHNCFMDMSVAPADLARDGEFFGWNKLMTRIQLKRLIETLDSTRTTHVKEAFESTHTKGISTGMEYTVPDINPWLVQAVRPDDWAAILDLPGARRGINYRNTYNVTFAVVRACPDDFGASGNTVHTYFAIIVNWCKVIYVEQLLPVHDYLPVVIAQPNDDGLSYQTQSMLDSTVPFQDMSSALWNMTLESKRRNVFDRLIYNPLMIDKKDIDPASSVARIPLRNAKLTDKDTNPMARAVYQIPYRDDNASANLQMSEMISAMADSAAGQNKVDRGQFQKGNKTKTEFEATMSGSNSRQQLAALTLEHHFITPIKEIVRANTMQYQAATTVLNRSERSMVDIDPIKLREATLEFKITDGNIPADKLMSPELITVFLQTASAIPVLNTEYDLLGMFVYFMKLRGASWLEDFKRDQASQDKFLQTARATMMNNNPQVVAAQQQATQQGNPTE